MEEKRTYTTIVQDVGRNTKLWKTNTFLLIIGSANFSMKNH
jgi:hypothetical protein